jgi:hypothetical protein
MTVDSLSELKSINILSELILRRTIICLKTFGIFTRIDFVCVILFIWYCHNQKVKQERNRAIVHI